MPTQATIAITPGSGQFLDAVSLVIGATTVVRETMVIADPTNPTYLATVTSAGALNVTDSILDGCITANVLAVSLPSAQITTLTPPSAAAIGSAVAADLLIGTQVAGSSLPVALPTATITALTPPSAAAIAAAIVANPPTISVSGNVGVTQSTTPWIVTGNLTHNNAAPAATEVGVLAALANASSPTFTEGKQTLLSVDLSGNLRVIASGGGGTQYTDLTAETAGAFTGTAVLGYNGTDVVALRMTATNDLYVAGHLTNNNAAPGATNIGALTVLANAAAPSWTEGDLVTASSDLAGNLRTILNAETTKVIGTTRITGNIGGVMDTTLGATKPANVLQVGGNDGTNAYAIPMASGGASILVSGSVSATVSGSVTAAQGTAAALSGYWPVGLSDGTNLIGVVGHPAYVQFATAQAVTVSSGSITVSGSVSVSGTVTANQGTAAAVTAPWPTRPGSPTTATWLQAPINVSAMGANIIVSAVGGQTVRVMRIFFVNSDPTNATNVTVQDTSPTSFTGPVRLITAGSFNGQDSNGEPLFVSGTGQGIQINSSVAVQLSGTVWYTQS